MLKILIDNVYVIDCVYLGAYVLMLLKVGALTIDNDYVTNCAYLGAYVLMLFKEGALTANNIVFNIV